jgi:GNAT superfamily N-acetyltransferase
MASGFDVRTIRSDELPQLLELYAQLHEEDAPLPADRMQEAWEALLSQPGLHVFVGELDGKVVSTCTLVIVPNLTRGASPYAVLENVVTHADYRKRGLGTQVLRAAFRKAWGEGCYKVMLLTSSKEEATLSFYEQAGLERGVKTGFVAYRQKGSGAD